MLACSWVGKTFVVVKLLCKKESPSCVIIIILRFASSVVGSYLALVNLFSRGNFRLIIWCVRAWFMLCRCPFLNTIARNVILVSCLCRGFRFYFMYNLTVLFWICWLDNPIPWVFRSKLQLDEGKETVSSPLFVSFGLSSILVGFFCCNQSAATYMVAYLFTQILLISMRSVSK